MLLDDMMRLAAEQSNRGYHLLDRVAQNLANTNTYGYKTQRFEQYIKEDGNIGEIKRTDYTPGSLYMSKRELDVGIAGPGFIPVTRKDGTVAYTRNGSLSKNAEGFLVTYHGDLVGTGIKVPAIYHQMQITKDGTVQITEKAGDDYKTIGKINLVNFPNPEGLKEIGNSLVLETSESGQALKVDNPTGFRQGFLEQSNVNIHFAVEDILRINAQVISNVKVLKMLDEIYKQAVQLRQ